MNLFQLENGDVVNLSQMTIAIADGNSHILKCADGSSWEISVNDYEVIQEMATVAFMQFRKLSDEVLG